MMAKWQEAMTPGEHHAWLAEMAGEWSYTNTSYMDPSAEPEVTQGKSVIKVVLGGRYLEEVHTGTSFGMPFEGHQTTGFDNISGKYRTNWYDNFGTGFMIGEGTREGNVLTIHASYPDFDGGTQKFRMVTTVQDKDNHTFEMFMVTPDGKEFRNMEIVYKRK